MSNYLQITNNPYKLLVGTIYNNSVVMPLSQLQKAVRSFDDFFSNWNDYKGEISSVIYIPIKMSNKNDYHLKTLRGSTSVIVKPIEAQYLLRLVSEFFISPKFNNFFDYQPYTKLLLYLPYVGNVEIDNKIFMNKYMRIILSFNPSTGESQYLICVSDIKIEKGKYYYDGRPRDDIGDYSIFTSCTIINSYSFNIGYTIPLGSSNYSDTIRNGVIGAIQGAVGLASNLFLSGNNVSTYTVSRPGISSTPNKSPQEVRQATKTQLTNTSTSIHSKDMGIPDAINSSLDIANASSANCSTERSSGGFSNMMLTNKPILQRFYSNIEESNEYLSEYSKNTGYILGKYKKLDSVSGFTVISQMHLEDIHLDYNNGFALNEELDMLEDILISSKGVFIDHFNDKYYPPLTTDSFGESNIVFAGNYLFKEEIGLPLSTIHTVRVDILFKSKLNSNPNKDVTFKGFGLDYYGMYFINDDEMSTTVRVYDANEGWIFTDTGDESATDHSISRNITVLQGVIDDLARNVFKNNLTKI